MNRKLILGIFAWLVVLCTIASMAVGLWGTSLWQRGSEEPKGVRASVEAPSSVVQGESLVIRISVENLTDQAMVLDSVDVAEGYLAGIDVLEADPAYSGSLSLPFGGVQSYAFDQETPTKQALIVQLIA